MSAPYNAIVKPRPNEDRYLDVLRRMTPERRLRKAAELSELTKEFALAGLRARHPDWSERELRREMAAMRSRWAS